MGDVNEPVVILNCPGFELRKTLQKRQVQILALSLLLSFCLAYGQGDDWGNICFLVPNPSLESCDQEDLALDPPDQIKAIFSDSFENSIHSGNRPFNDFHSAPFQAFFFDEKNVVLRC
jgi:hypothetical protein